MTTAWFTFGQTHVHSVNGKTFDKDCVVEITAEEPRDVMFATFGPVWAMQYSEKPNMEYYPRGIFKLGTENGTKRPREPKDSIIVRCGECRRIIFASVNDPRVMNAERFKDIGKLIQKGCTVEHMTSEEVRNSDFGCKCPK